MLVRSRSRKTTRKEVGAMEVGRDVDKAGEIEKAGSPQSLAMVEPLYWRVGNQRGFPQWRTHYRRNLFQPRIRRVS